MTIAINKEMKKNGIVVNHKRVERIMKKLDLKARPKVKHYVSYEGTVGKIAPNIINRDFSTNFPYQKLGTDVTVFITPYCRLYLSPIIDFNSREIVAYDLSEHPDFRQINSMFKNLINKRIKLSPGVILHSDQGWQYQMKAYREKLHKLKFVQSMSRKGNCLDNSPTENFFGRMKEEMFYDKEHLYKNKEELIKAIKDYISYYNSERIVTRLKMSPYEYLENLGLRWYDIKRVKNP